MSNIANPAAPSSKRSAGPGFILFLITIVPITLFNGWVLSVIWNWFMPVVFPELPPLELIHALGLSLVISTFTAGLTPKPDPKKSLLDLMIDLVVMVFVRGGVFLLLGFIYQLFL